VANASELAGLDPSFLFPLYTLEEHSASAIRQINNPGMTFIMSNLLYYEFRQAVRRQIFMSKHNHAVGFTESQGKKILEIFDADCAKGIFKRVAENTIEILQIAENLSATYTGRYGYRGFDILQVASALQMKADRFLTFDATQKKLAKAVGLKC
jgi:hypothetical protein